MNEFANKLIHLIKKILKYLFGKEHLARTFWSVVVTLAFFFFGIWYNEGKEPSRVYVTNTSDLRDTIVLRIEGQANSPNKILEDRIEQLVRDVGSLRRYMSRSGPQTTSSPLDRLEPRPLSTFGNTPGQKESIKMVKVPLAVEPNRAQIKIPKFQLPSRVKGYTEGKLSSFAKLTLPKTQYHDDEEIQFTIELLDPTILGKISPLIVDVLRKDAEYRYTLLYNQQFVLQPTNNLVSLIADFGVGKFILQAGFYLVDEVDQEYPPLYRTQIEIEVKK